MIFGDGLKHLKDTPDYFYSYIVFDLDSESILANQLEWIAEIHRCLLPNGLLTCQDGPHQSNSYFYKVAKEVFQTEPVRKAVLDWSFLNVAKKQV